MIKTRKIGIEFDQGADLKFVIGIFGVSGLTDITGYEFLGEIKATTSPDDAVVAEFEFQILDQKTHKGKVACSLPLSASVDIVTSVSNALQSQRLTTPYVYDIKMKDTSNIVSRIIEGIIFASPESTQETF